MGKEREMGEERGWGKRGEIRKGRGIWKKRRDGEGEGALS